jgi:hypothetical protein
MRESPALEAFLSFGLNQQFAGQEPAALSSPRVEEVPAANRDYQFDKAWISISVERSAGS